MVLITTSSTIQEYLLYWNSPACFPNARQITRNYKGSLIRRFLLPCLGSVKLNQYSREDVASLHRFVASDTDTTKQTKAQALGVFRYAMICAERRLLIRDAFRDAFHIESIPSTPVKIYSPEELDTIFSVIEYLPLRNYYHLIYYTGIETSEIAGLRCADIDLEERLLHVRQRILGRSPRDLLIVPLEDSQQRRDLFLTDQAIECIRAELRQAEIKKHQPFWHDNGLDLLFTTRNGSPITRSNMWRVRQILQRTAGIDCFSSLNLRYTAANALLKSGASEKMVQDFLGFASLSYTFQVHHEKMAKE